MNSACLAQGSASMWAARGRIARAPDMCPLSNIVIPIGAGFPEKILTADQALRQCCILAQLGHRGRTTAELPTFSRDGPVFCCPNYQDPRAGISTRYISIEQMF